jgi:hypothetical protein
VKDWATPFVLEDFHMGQSRKKTPISGITTARSEKEWKQEVHRTQRRIEREILRKADDLEAIQLPEKREIDSVWNAPKDGKYIFDPKKHPKLMRK